MRWGGSPYPPGAFGKIKDLLFRVSAVIILQRDCLGWGMSVVTWELMEVTPTSRGLPQPLTWLYGGMIVPQIRDLGFPLPGSQKGGPTLMRLHSGRVRDNRPRGRGMTRRFLGVPPASMAPDCLSLARGHIAHQKGAVAWHPGLPPPASSRGMRPGRRAWGRGTYPSPSWEPRSYCPLSLGSLISRGGSYPQPASAQAFPLLGCSSHQHPHRD